MDNMPLDPLLLSQTQLENDMSHLVQKGVLELPYVIVTTSLLSKNLYFRCLLTEIDMSLTEHSFRLLPFVAR